ncbi:aminotransferase class V-fold PLP-dependent enzyme [Flexilinea flocculi]|uniref:Cysteine desulfurase family protein n=1 Tax=Flexilinea flocculi TaxID=1678840 RepID=A0A0S7BJI1_9CHLR|nr:aminotransferase class V-fold PLP-dependent enzyme [Flexilinea flocculi]GAP40493.1 cysteine desulfurase family protein [Flexilinea flocculi]
MTVIYMDNAATSWPKPAEVSAAMIKTMEEAGGNAGRGGHRFAVAAGEILYQVRETVAAFFGSDDPFRVTFTANATESINLILKGYLKQGDHVLVSPLEHNAVMRPLQFLSQQNIQWSVLPAGKDGRINPALIEPMIRQNTRLFVICHESNVNGVIQPLHEISEIAHSYQIPVLADCSQSAGSIPIAIDCEGIDFLAFTGHKSLLGPVGTGGIVWGSHVDVNQIFPLKQGGTGSASDRYVQPDFLPDKFESGTLNTVGLAGLKAGIDWINRNQQNLVYLKKGELFREFLNEIRSIRRVHVFCAEKIENQGFVFSLTIDGIDNGFAAQWLDEEKGILSRVGLHCAPLAHRFLHSFPAGTIRFAASPFTTSQDFEACIEAVKILAENTTTLH